MFTKLQTTLQNKEKNDGRELSESLFNTKFLPYPTTTSIILVGNGSQAAIVYWYFLEGFLELSYPFS